MLTSPGRQARIIPFAAVAGLAVASGVVGGLNLVAVAIAAGLTTVIIAAAVWGDWSRVPDHAQSIPALAYFAVVAILLLAAPAGSSAGFAPLALLPVMWLALYGTRRDVLIALTLALVVLSTSWWFQHAGTATSDEAGRRMTLLWLISVLVSWTSQRLVAELARLHAATANSEHDLRDVAHAVRALYADVGSGVDVRQSLCRETAIRTGAAHAFYAQPDPDQVRLSSWRPGVVPPDPADVALVRDAAARHLTNSDKSRLPTTSLLPAYGESGETAVLHVEPVPRGGSRDAALVVLWTRGEDSAPHLRFLSLLAGEAGDILTRQEQLTALTLTARTDALTGVANRRHWDEVLEATLAAAAGPGSRVTLALIDLDHFKTFNDTHGHPAGDRMLVAAANAWRAHLRAEDLLARYGGEEFAILLPGCALSEAGPVLGRVRTSTPQEQTCSIGAAEWDGTESGAHLVQRADQALYRAKEDGRDRLVTAPSAPAPEP